MCKNTDAVTVNKVEAHNNVEILTGYDTLEIKGEKLVNGLVIKNRETGEQKQLAVEGIFIEIGLIPNSDFAADFLELNKQREIIIDFEGQTSVKGIFAAGDVTDVPRNKRHCCR